MPQFLNSDNLIAKRKYSTIHFQNLYQFVTLKNLKM